jgi:hypothetical protein
MVAIDQFLEELCPLNEKSVFWTFSLFAYTFDIWYIALPFSRYRSSLSLVLIH